MLGLSRLRSSLFMTYDRYLVQSTLQVLPQVYIVRVVHVINMTKSRALVVSCFQLEV